MHLSQRFTESSIFTSAKLLRNFRRIASNKSYQFCHQQSTCLEKTDPWHRLLAENPARYKFLRTMEPYHFLDYEEQLKKKSSMAKESMKKLYHIALYNKGKATKSLLQQVEENGGYACPVDPIIPSPLLCGYRNKDRYAVGQHLEGKAKSVGFLVYDKLSKSLKIINGQMKGNRKIHKEISEVYEEFLQQSEVNVVGSESGHWRHLVVRSNSQGDVLTSVCFNDRQKPREFVDKARDGFYKYFVHGPGRNLGINSLYFQVSHKVNPTAEDGEYELLHHTHDDPHLYETISDRRFRVSPDSFLQLNTAAAEVLYDTVRTYAGLDDNTVLVDVCCGTGTIGIVLARYVKRVIGIEKVRQAVEDAKFNAKLNGVENAEFWCGRAEKDLKHILQGCSEEEKVVAIVNPGRGGLGAKVMRALRRCEAIRQVVYVSCKPHGRACYNFQELCSEEGEKFPKQPFLPVKATAVDMFPHTRHYDMVLVFQR